jgi:hypothetical protein
MEGSTARGDDGTRGCPLSPSNPVPVYRPFAVSMNLRIHSISRAHSPGITPRPALQSGPFAAPHHAGPQCSITPADSMRPRALVSGQSVHFALEEELLASISLESQREP